MIYLDNAATTKLCKTAIEELIKYSVDEFFNPSAVYAWKNANKLRQAKQVIAQKLGVNFDNNIIFTGSATEANNLAFSAVSDNFVVSEGEHPSIYNKAVALKNAGKNVKIVPLAPNGQIDLDKLKQALDSSTKFISVMHVSNETGVINDLKKIVELKNKICPNAILHSDGVQAFCKVDTSIVKQLDMYTISAHKIGGPKGIGALYCKNKTKLKPIVEGGGQEYNLRSGTENLPAIMAFKATCETRKQNLDYIQRLKDELVSKLDDRIIQNVDNGQKLSPYVVSLRVTGVNGETFVNAVAGKGLYISTGSACSSKKVGNRVLASMGKSIDEIKQSIRISFFETSTLEEIDLAVEIINKTYAELTAKLN